MAKVTPRGSRMLVGKEAIELADLQNAEVAVLTVKEVDTNISTSLNRRSSAVVFEEVPNRFMWLDAGGEHAMVAHLGDEDTDWVGQPVPVVKVTRVNPQTDRPVTKYVVADADDWKEILKQDAKGKKKAAK